MWCPVSPGAPGAEGATAGRAVSSPFATREMKAQVTQVMAELGMDQVVVSAQGP